MSGPAAPPPPWLDHGTAREAGYWWHQAILSGRARETWRMLTHAYRQRLATRYVEAVNDELAGSDKLLDPEALAEALADDQCDQDWWLEGIRQSFADNFPVHWGWSSDPRPVAPDTEIVICFDARQLDLGPDSRIREGTIANGVKLYMHLEDTGRWCVAGVNEPPSGSLA